MQRSNISLGLIDKVQQWPQTEAEARENNFESKNCDFRNILEGKNASFIMGQNIISSANTLPGLKRNLDLLLLMTSFAKVKCFIGAYR